MIQRIQSIYVALAIVLHTIGIFFPWVTYTLDTDAQALQAFASGWSNNIILGVLMVVSILGAIVVLLSFKDRTKQLRLVNVAMGLMAIEFLGFCTLHYLNIEAAVSDNVSLAYGWPVAVPAVSVVLLWLAKKGIQKDEALVKSVDRLR